MTHLVPVLRPVLGSPFRRASLYRAAGEMPSWHIAPVRTGTVTDLISGSQIITFTNSSPAMGFNSSGLLVLPTPNVPFIEYDPATGACLGWRVWDAVTNSIRNNTMVGAVAGTPGTLPTNWSTSLPAGLTRQVVGVGAVNGIEYIDIRFSGTPTITSNIQIKPDGNAGAIAATASQSWAISSWVAVVAGSTANLSSPRLALNDYSAGPTYLRTTIYASNVLSAGSTFARVSGVNTTGASTTIVEPLFLFDVTSGLAVDITIRIGLPQLQQSATVGPVVKTSGLTASSTADVASITGAAFAGIWNAVEMTIYAEGFVRSQATAAAYPRLFTAVGANPGNDEIGIYTRAGVGIDDGMIFASSTISGVTQADLTPLVGSAVNNYKSAYAFKANDFALCNNGITPSGTAIDTSGSLPSVSEFRIYGQARFQPQPAGYIREMATLKSRRPNTNLQAMTQ